LAATSKVPPSAHTAFAERFVTEIHDSRDDAHARWIRCNAKHDIYDRFGRQASNRGASDMQYLVRAQTRIYDKALSLRSEQRRPTFAVFHHLHRLVDGSHSKATELRLSCGNRFL
jgi:hypothetical protein